MPKPTQNLVEKYCKISDFLIYILDNRDYFLGDQLENIQNKKDELEVLSNFLKNFML